MDTLTIRKAHEGKELKDFLDLPQLIYKECAQYVPDFREDVSRIFDPHYNAGLKFSSVQPFVAYRDGQAVGRIVGVINRKANRTWQQDVVRFSMIEFIDDRSVAAALLNTVEAWGRSEGMKVIQGPMGITDFDKEGMLVEDFNLTGAMTSYYNLPYYPEHLTALGYEKAVDWVQVRIDIPKEVPAKYARVAQYARQTVGLRVKKVTRSDVLDGYGKKVFDLLNAAYAPIFGFSALSQEQAQEFLQKYVPLLDMNLVPMVENEAGELIGTAVTLPSLVRALQQSGGRLWPFGWWPLLRSMKLRHEDNVEMLLVAVRPDYQGLGVNALFFDDLIPIYNRCGYKWAETGPQLEDNMKELTQWKPLNPQYVKRRRCFKKTIQQ